jgi:hypothetical protein
MKRLTTLSLLSALFVIFSIQSAFAGPFGIDMGMSLAEVRKVCKTVPELIQDNVYEITPPKTNDMFETYYVRIDPEYGVYWLKAIGKDIYTNGYGDRVRSTFQSLVASIRRTYGQELYLTDELKEESILTDSQYFMHALERGDRTLEAVWSKFDENSGIFILNSLLKDPEYKDRVMEYMATSDTTAFKALVMEKALQYKELPSDISIIGVYATAQSSSLGSVWLEYRFSNSDAVDAKAESVF